MRGWRTLGLTAGNDRAANWQMRLNEVRAMRNLVPVKHLPSLTSNPEYSYTYTSLTTYVLASPLVFKQREMKLHRIIEAQTFITKGRHDQGTAATWNERHLGYVQRAV
jgi:hypothetical protein